MAGLPPDDVSIPRSVTALAAGRSLRPVWINALGGLTFEIDGDAHRFFVKWSPIGGVDLAAEAMRMKWATTYTAVPALLDSGSDDEGSWLMSAAVPGEYAVAARWKADPATAVAAIGSGLRAFHDALPVEDCPFSWSAADRVAAAVRRASDGLHRPADWHHTHQHLTVEEALVEVADPPPVDQLVVCHGDTCAPNILLDESGRCVGYVDVGSLGVADRWADLAIATWSTTWNYGPGWEEPLLAAYGVAPDPERTSYYRLLWDLGP